jgi:hypothetical protein
MTSPTQRRGEHQARRAATNNDHFSFVGQHYFSFNRLSSSVVRSAGARIRLWTVRVVSRRRVGCHSPTLVEQPHTARAHHRASGPAALFTFDLTTRQCYDILTPARARRSATGQVRWPLADATLVLAAEIWGEVVRRATARSDRRSKGRRLDEVAIGQRPQGTEQ